MMQQTRKHPPRPTQTQDFIRRLMSSDSDPKEKEALRALSKRMVKLFENNPSQFVSEGAELSSVTTGKDYEDLLRAFSNAIIKGTADGSNLDPTLLKDLAYVIRRAKDNLSVES